MFCLRLSRSPIRPALIIISITLGNGDVGRHGEAGHGGWISRGSGMGTSMGPSGIVMCIPFAKVKTRSCSVRVAGAVSHLVYHSPHNERRASTGYPIVGIRVRFRLGISHVMPRFPTLCKPISKAILAPMPKNCFESDGDKATAARPTYPTQAICVLGWSAMSPSLFETHLAVCVPRQDK